MPNQTYIGIFKELPSSKNTIMPFTSESEFSQWFDSNKNIKWGTLLNQDSGRTELSHSRPISSIMRDDKPNTSTEEQNAPIGKYINRIDTERTVVLVQLLNGKTIGIDHEQACLYSNEEEMYFDYDEARYGRINLLADRIGLLDIENIDSAGINYLVKHISTLNISPSYKPEDASLADFIYLHNGRVLLVDDKSVTLYDSDNIRNLPPIEIAGRLDLTAEPSDDNRPSNA